MKNRRAHDRSSNAGFTLIETLIATAMMVAILAALATVTSQWLPNWNRGFVRVQRSELLALGLERIVADLAAAEFVPPNGRTRNPLFEGSELSVTFVRSTLGPNMSSGLEIVRLAEVKNRQGLALVRLRSPFVPLAVGSPINSQIKFSEPVVLVRAPYRISFSYAGPDRVWKDTWRDADAAQLPRAVRILLRDAETQQVLSVSTATPIHVEVAADCIRANNAKGCGTANPPVSDNL